MVIPIIKYWKGKFSCPVCGDFKPDEIWFLVEHMELAHTKSELSRTIFDLLMTSLSKYFKYGYPQLVLEDVEEKFMGAV